MACKPLCENTTLSKAKGVSRILNLMRVFKGQRCPKPQPQCGRATGEGSGHLPEVEDVETVDRQGLGMWPADLNTQMQRASSPHT